MHMRVQSFVKTGKKRVLMKTCIEMEAIKSKEI